MNVVLVHGFLDSARIMSGLSRRLAAEGHACFAPSLKPADARSGLAALSAQLRRFIELSLPPDARLALVGYSMGALVCRHYLQELDGRNRVDAFFSITGPHAGTVVAYLYPGRGAKEMRPGSEFIRRLEATAERLAGVPTVCYWSPLDPLVVPTKSARLHATEHVRVPFSFHPIITHDRRIQRDIAARLKGVAPKI
ncbi:MAG TPA: alpha/beta fold hydrolase [Lacunisphaera sp.]|jgi:triacylglycerol lipase|nr:alpha/beta fold hydrolase [Lacunisphaera sp.]